MGQVEYVEDVVLGLGRVVHVEHLEDVEYLGRRGRR